MIKGERASVSADRGEPNPRLLVPAILAVSHAGGGDAGTTLRTRRRRYQMRRTLSGHGNCGNNQHGDPSDHCAADASGHRKSFPGVRD